jgi:predicted amino acid-binding ACT domain protein
MSQQPVLAVVSVLGKDQKGVVAQFATYMAERGINIQDIEQRVVRGSLSWTCWSISGTCRSISPS